MCKSYDRNTEAIENVQVALQFFREGKHSREALQGLMILGASRANLGQFAEAGDNVKEAIDGFDRAADKKNGAQARAVLSEIFAKNGRWTEALVLQQKDLDERGTLPNGIPRLSGLIAMGRLFGKLGRYAEARADLQEVESRIPNVPGTQAELRGRLASVGAEIAYSQRKWRDAMIFAGRAHPAKTINIQRSS